MMFIVCSACRGYNIERRWCSVCEGKGVVQTNSGLPTAARTSSQIKAMLTASQEHGNDQ